MVHQHVPDIPGVPQELVIVGERRNVGRTQHPLHNGGNLGCRQTATPLLVHGTLIGDLLGLGHVGQLGHLAITSRLLVDVGRAVANPLTGHENRHGAVKLELHHLQRTRVQMAHEVTDESAIVGHLARVLARERLARGLRDGGITAHVIDQDHEPVIENGEPLVEQLFRSLYDVSCHPVLLVSR
jgi:hypothetical protein